MSAFDPKQTSSRPSFRRREFITLLGATIAGSAGASAQTSNDFHLGTVRPGMPLSENSPGGRILIRVLGDRGYKLGQNLRFSSRGAMRNISLLPDIMQEMKTNRGAQSAPNDNSSQFKLGANVR